MTQRARTAKQLGAIIHRERRRQGLTQTQLGAKIGLRQATISKLEAGKPATQLRTLLDALRQTVDERQPASTPAPGRLLPGPFNPAHAQI